MERGVVLLRIFGVRNEDWRPQRGCGVAHAAAL